MERITESLDIAERGLSRKSINAGGGSSQAITERRRVS